jgi:hypothetical protein
LDQMKLNMWEVYKMALNISGRSIVAAIRFVLRLWASHRDTLAPEMPAEAVAALDALQTALAAIELINPPGAA